MFVWFLDSVTKLFHTRSCENCRWDVPAAAVIHPHKLLLRLRTQFSTSFISTRMHSCFVVFISSIHSFFFIQFKRSLSYFMCFHFLLFFHLLWFYISYFSLMLIHFIFTHSNFHRSRYKLDLLCWHCCPLLFRVDKICSYSNFIRTHYHSFKNFSHSFIT